MFWLRNKKNNFSLRALIWGPVYVLHSHIILRSHARGGNRYQGFDIKKMSPQCRTYTRAMQNEKSIFPSGAGGGGSNLFCEHISSMYK